MEPYTKNPENKVESEGKQSPRSGRVLAGFIVISVGLVFLARELGAEIPRWIFSWPSFLIVFGFYLGARHSFRNWVWLIPVAIGSAFLADRWFYMYDFNLTQLVWPIIIIGVGLYMIFKPRTASDKVDWTKLKFEQPTGNLSDEDVIDATSIFGHTKKTILSKNFRGGDVVNFFGGTELNMSQADINGAVLLDMTQVFGGAKIIVPSNWKVQSELVSVFGGVDDKRMISPNVDQNKVLVLKGTCIFGGLEIKSY